MPTQKIKTMSTTTIPTLIYIVGVDIKVGIVGRWKFGNIVGVGIAGVGIIAPTRVELSLLSLSNMF